jgi:catechol 2,3-dioxygenase-like lactoylglutathione lyase family enzyme
MTAMPTTPTRNGPAGRVLHICHSCADADTSAARLGSALGLREVMRTDGSRADGALFGMAGMIRSTAVFLYDDRGPRVAPAIEVQGWSEPDVLGEPVAEAHHVGIQAVGVAVADPPVARQRLVDAGSTVVDHLPGLSSVRTPDGHVIDLVASDDGATRIAHLRITCTDVAASTAWYQRLGFAPTAPLDTSLDRVAIQRMRLAEEPLEVLLTEWTSPRSQGRHYAEANHAGYYRVALRVEDTRAAYEELTADGWDFDAPPLAVAMPGTPVPDLWIAFTRDPDGVVYELVQRPLANFAGKPA